METILAQLIGGAVGGIASGKLLKSAHLRQIGNLIAGGVGGVGGGQLLGALLGRERAMLPRGSVSPPWQDSSLAVALPVQSSRSSSA
jgi:Na+/citrate or Na+/malate symporter